jgi:hypothetical protein
MTSLTRGRLEAIIEALDFSLQMRLPSALGVRSDYQRARKWAADEIAKRDKRCERRRPTNAFEPRQYTGK